MKPVIDDAGQWVKGVLHAHRCMFSKSGRRRSFFCGSRLSCTVPRFRRKQGNPSSVNIPFTTVCVRPVIRTGRRYDEVGPHLAPSTECGENGVRPERLQVVRAARHGTIHGVTTVFGLIHTVPAQQRPAFWASSIPMLRFPGTRHILPPLFGREVGLDGALLVHIASL